MSPLSRRDFWMAGICGFILSPRSGVPSVQERRKKRLAGLMRLAKIDNLPKIGWREVG